MYFTYVWRTGVYFTPYLTRQQDWNSFKYTGCQPNIWVDLGLSDLSVPSDNEFLYKFNNEPYRGCTQLTVDYIKQTNVTKYIHVRLYIKFDKHLHLFGSYAP